MKTKEEREQIVVKASDEILATCEKYDVKLTISDGLISIHHGEWHKNGDYSVLEVSLPEKSTL